MSRLLRCDGELMENGKSKKVLQIAGTALIVIACVSIITTTFFVKPFKVSGDSMLNTYQNGQLVFVDKMAYKSSKPQTGDVIVLKQGGKRLIKRVIGTPGDTLEIKDNAVYKNGNYLAEPYVGKWSSYETVQQKVPEGQYYVMGDNRDQSRDSRSFGYVDESLIIGKVMD